MQSVTPEPANGTQRAGGIPGVSALLGFQWPVVLPPSQPEWRCLAMTKLSGLINADGWIRFTACPSRSFDPAQLCCSPACPPPSLSSNRPLTPSSSSSSFNPTKGERFAKRRLPFRRSGTPHRLDFVTRFRRDSFTSARTSI